MLATVSGFRPIIPIPHPAVYVSGNVPLWLALLFLVVIPVLLAGGFFLVMTVTEARYKRRMAARTRR